MTWWLVWFGRRGGIRYISHLDQARAVQRTFARAGIGIALSEGMRPKPRLSLPLPLPVGAEATRELAVVAVADALDAATDSVIAPDPGTALRALRAVAPEGLSFDEIVIARERPRPQPASATYSCSIPAGPAVVGSAIDDVVAAGALVVERRSPKGVRSIDLRPFITSLTLVPDERVEASTVSFTLRYRREGSARPNEIVAVLSERTATEPVVRDLVRSGVRFEGLPRAAGAAGTE